MARRRATVSSTLSTVNMTLRRPGAFGGAIAGSISTSFGLRNFVSSSRPCPSGVRIMTMSTWTLSSPLTRSTHGPSTGAWPSSVMPSAVKKAIAAARSSTTTLTWSNLLIVKSLLRGAPERNEDTPVRLAAPLGPGPRLLPEDLLGPHRPAPARPFPQRSVRSQLPRLHIVGEEHIEDVGEPGLVL